MSILREHYKECNRESWKGDAWWQKCGNRRFVCRPWYIQSYRHIF